MLRLSELSASYIGLTAISQLRKIANLSIDRGRSTLCIDACVHVGIVMEFSSLGLGASEDRATA